MLPDKMLQGNLFACSGNLLAWASIGKEFTLKKWHIDWPHGSCVWFSVIILHLPFYKLGYACCPIAPNWQTAAPSPYAYEFDAWSSRAFRNDEGLFVASSQNIQQLSYSMSWNDIRVAGMFKCLLLMNDNVERLFSYVKWKVALFDIDMITKLGTLCSCSHVMLCSNCIVCHSHASSHIPSVWSLPSTPLPCGANMTTMALLFPIEVGVFLSRWLVQAAPPKAAGSASE